ncbi:hypothetical protein Q5M85_21465 [Paraclostridium bifermentans]|nr:hypothetical protein [Paraclostridium bifermentans]
MFYNDILEGNFNNKTEVTNRKRAFYKLFDNVSSSNLTNYEIVENLQEYFNDYLKEIELNDIKNQYL